MIIINYKGIVLSKRLHPENAFIIPLSSLRNNETVWLLNSDSTLIIEKIELVHIQNNQAIILAGVVLILILTFLDKYGFKSNTKRPYLAIFTCLLALFYVGGIWGNWFWTNEADRVIPIISSIFAVGLNTGIPLVIDIK